MYSNYNFTILDKSKSATGQQSFDDFVLRLKEAFPTPNSSLDLNLSPERGKQASYNDELAYYQAIKVSHAVIIRENSTIDTPLIHDLLFAMSQKKPICLPDVPTFSDNVTPFAKEVLMSRLSKTMLCDLNQLDNSDLKQFLGNIASQSINYVLTKHESTLIAAMLRKHFRQLLV